jgi:hypothetical protein
MKEAKPGQQTMSHKQIEKAEPSFHSSNVLPLTPTSPSPPATPQPSFVFHHCMPQISSLRFPSSCNEDVCHLRGQPFLPVLKINPERSMAGPSRKLKNKTEQLPPLSFSHYQPTPVIVHTDNIFAQNRPQDEQKILSLANLRLKAAEHKRQLGLSGAM